MNICPRTPLPLAGGDAISSNLHLTLYHPGFFRLLSSSYLQLNPCKLNGLSHSCLNWFISKHKTTITNTIANPCTIQLLQTEICFLFIAQFRFLLSTTQLCLNLLISDKKTNHNHNHNLQHQTPAI